MEKEILSSQDLPKHVQGEVGSSASIFPYIYGCVVCGGANDEDKIILCDGPGCNRETHLYCLRPPLDKVPDGEWFCDVCDPLGSSLHLQAYLEDIEENRRLFNPQTKESYEIYIHSNLLPLESWVPGQESLLDCEFPLSGEGLVGQKVCVFTTTDCRQHTGRIIGARFDETLCKWDHMVHFKR